MRRLPLCACLRVADLNRGSNFSRRRRSASLSKWWPSIRIQHGPLFPGANVLLFDSGCADGDTKPGAATIPETATRFRRRCARGSRPSSSAPSCLCLALTAATTPCHDARQPQQSTAEQGERAGFGDNAGFTERRISFSFCQGRCLLKKSCGSRHYPRKVAN